ncbi:MAG: SDR family NAD(P)-dependent oxidoreductase [Candidatus Acidiferrales bacterium]
MELGLKGKVALVTGSSKGIGFAIAQALAREGCKVVINGRNASDLDSAAAQIRDAKSASGAAATVHTVASDVAAPGGAERAVAETVAHFGAIHILVNNAGGIGRFGAFAELTDDEWLQIFQLNVMSAVRASRAALPHMQRQKWGRIVNISSESGTQPDALMPHYNASKSALNSLTKSLSKAYGPDGILVNAVSPAFIRTPLVEETLANQAKSRGISVDEAERVFVREFRPNIVFGRAGRPDETAGVVVFLASEQASFITGSNYRVDGGSVASL